MQPDPNRYDDDPEDYPEEQADEGDDANGADGESFELSAEEEAGLSQIHDPHIRKHLRGIRQGIERKKKAHAAQSSPKATERHDMKDEKQEPLPLVTEEELAAIADPAERARQRAWYTKFYKDYPNGLARAKEKSAALIAERKRLLHLPIIPQETRPTVNVIANSALFAAVQGKDRQLLHKRLLDTPRWRRNHFQRRAIQSGNGSDSFMRR